MNASALRDYYWLIGYGIDSKQRAFGVLISMDTVLLPFSFFSFRDTREENEKRKNEPPGLLALQLLFFLFCSSGAGWLLGWLTGFYIKTMIQPASRGKTGILALGGKRIFAS